MEAGRIQNRQESDFQIQNQNSKSLCSDWSANQILGISDYEFGSLKE